jgi:hypothetical protein
MAAVATNAPLPISRDAAIALLRDILLRLAGPDTSICKVAADRGIFCRGFRRYDDAALREEYKWIDERRPGISREELETLGDRWQLARQEVHQLPTACDVQTFTPRSTPSTSE